MGEVIPVNFGIEREWEAVHEKLINDLTTVGSMFGDDEKLMRAKADFAYFTMRKIVKDVPSVIEIKTSLPQEQLDALAGVIDEVVHAGIMAALDHSLAVLLISMCGLCTSCLAGHSES